MCCLFSFQSLTLRTIPGSLRRLRKPSRKIPRRNSSVAFKVEFLICYFIFNCVWWHTGDLRNGYRGSVGYTWALVACVFFFVSLVFPLGGGLWWHLLNPPSLVPQLAQIETEKFKKSKIFLGISCQANTVTLDHLRVQHANGDGVRDDIYQMCVRPISLLSRLWVVPGWR